MRREEKEGEPMDRRKKLILGGAVVLAVVGTGAGIGIAASGDDDQELQGSARDRATEAALDHTGGGTVIETETGDAGAAYGVEIEKDDGSVVEVELDENFQVIGSEQDDDGPNDVDEPGEDD
jgi:hypothetical protein